MLAVWSESALSGEQACDLESQGAMISLGPSFYPAPIIGGSLTRKEVQTFAVTQISEKWICSGSKRG
jgi:hypothetical protein